MISTSWPKIINVILVIKPFSLLTFWMYFLVSNWILAKVQHTCVCLWIIWHPVILSNENEIPFWCFDKICGYLQKLFFFPISDTDVVDIVDSILSTVVKLVNSYKVSAVGRDSLMQVLLSIISRKNGINWAKKFLNLSGGKIWLALFSGKWMF